MENCRHFLKNAQDWNRDIPIGIGMPTPIPSPQPRPNPVITCPRATRKGCCGTWRTAASTAPSLLLLLRPALLLCNPTMILRNWPPHKCSTPPLAQHVHCLWTLSARASLPNAHTLAPNWKSTWPYSWCSAFLLSSASSSSWYANWGSHLWILLTCLPFDFLRLLLGMTV